MVLLLEVKMTPPLQRAALISRFPPPLVLSSPSVFSLSLSVSLSLSLPFFLSFFTPPLSPVHSSAVLLSTEPPGFSSASQDP